MAKFSLRIVLFFTLVVFLSICTTAQTQGPSISANQGVPGISRDFLDWISFFPLEVGNEWSYSDGNNIFTVQVLSETRETNGRTYFEVSGYFPNDSVKVRKIRRDLLGQVLEYNPKGEDFLWYRIGLLRGAWRIETGEGLTCIAGSQVRTGDFGEMVKIPAGAFERTLRLDFVAPCADAGISREYFASGVGLVRRVLETIAGPRTVDLVSARVGSLQLPETPYGVEVSVDRPVYFNNFMPPIVNPSPTLKARLVVRNETDLPVELAFPTAQRFDFIVRDALGKEVLRWSDGRSFAMVLGQERLFKGSRGYSADLLLKDRKGKPLPAGIYTLLGYLTTPGSESGLVTLGGIVSFEIRDIH